MFRSFFKVAFRILMRDSVHTLINISGLAIGLAFSIIIFLYVHQETSYDRFHQNADRIFRVGINGKVSLNRFHHAVTPAPLSNTLIREIPEVENSVRVARFGAWLVRYKDARFNEDRIIFADSTFFTLFSFPLLSGNAQDVLRKPKSIVLSQSKARLYFGKEDPLGKLLQIENDSTFYRVTGIMADVPKNSHMHFDMVGSLSTFDKMLEEHRWVVNFLYTYFLSKPGFSKETLQASLQPLVQRYVLPDYEKFLDIAPGTDENTGDTYSFVVQPITDIHLKSDFALEFEPVGNILYIYLFMALAVITLLLSCINFISLATVRSVYRAREVCIRKIAGSQKRILVRQFLVESSLLAFLSMALALFITEMALPPFNRYMVLDLRLSQLLNSSGALFMIGLILIIGVFSGLYPALHFSSFSTLNVLRNRPQKFSGRSHFRSGLVLIQLIMSMGAITMTGIVLGQYRYLVHKDLGFNKENLLIIRRPDGLKNKLNDFKKQIGRYPGVVSVTSSISIPGSSFPRIPYYLKGSPVTKNHSASSLFVSYGFDSTYRIHLQQGRFFNASQPGDSETCVINESMARQLGNHDLIGRTLVGLIPMHDRKYELRIIGITGDFNYEVLENPVLPMVMILVKGNPEGYLTVRLNPGDPETSIQHLKSVWEEYTTAYPFVCFFLDSDLQSRYGRVRETGRIFFILSIVAVLIACLGLFGLVSYANVRRGYEISVRKAMGADARKIILFEIRKVMMLLLISSMIAWIGIYFLVNSWLSGYSNFVELNALYFFLPFLAVLLISLITVYYQAYMAAHSSPGTVLKYE